MVATQALMQDSDWQAQRELEWKAIDEGVRRYRKDRRQAIEKGRAGELSVSQLAMAHWFTAVEASIARDIANFKSTGMCIMVDPEAMEAMSEMPPGELAYLAMWCVINELAGAPAGKTCAKVYHQIGRAVLSELAYRHLKEHDPDEWRTIKDGYRRLTPTVLAQRVKRESLDPRWKQTRLRTQIGTKLLRTVHEYASCSSYDSDGGSEIIDNFMPAFEIFSRVNGKHSTYHIRMTSDCLQMLEDAHKGREHLRPMHMPMVCKPLLWTDEGRGGYISLRTSLVIRSSKRQRDMIADDRNTIYKPGLNVINRTPYALNKWLVNLQQSMFRRGGGRAMLPLLENKPGLPMPEGYRAEIERGKGRWAQVDDDEAREWRKRMRGVHDTNIAAQAERYCFLAYQDVCRVVGDYDHFYVPMVFDTRGRLVPSAKWLHHHSNKAVRAAILFADPVPLDERGHFWLKVHAANMFGFDKGTFEERAAWSDEHMDRMKEIGNDPHSDYWWTEADGGDNCWQFLAACKAFVDPWTAERLPVQMDGSNNGLQHYAAMMRDRQGAEMVNVLPGERPADSYEAVAGDVIEMLGSHDIADTFVPTEAHAKRGSKPCTVDGSAEWIRRLMDRKMAKPPVMTSVYDVTDYGMRDQIYDAISDRATGLSNRQVGKLATDTQRLIRTAIGSRFPGAMDAMTWIRKSASEIAKSGELVEWRNPIGFPVVQPYRKSPSRRLNTVFGQVRIINDDMTEGKPMVSKQAAGAAPNVVHSVDMAHLLTTAIQCDKDMVHMGAVHDSYWTQAGHVDRLRRHTNECFVRVHRRPFLSQLHAQWCERYPSVKFEEPPHVGTFEIEGAANSPYLFS